MSKHDEVLGKWYEDLQRIFSNGCAKRNYILGSKKRRKGEIDIRVDLDDEVLVFEVKTSFRDIYHFKTHGGAIAQLLKIERYLRNVEHEKNIEKYIIVNDPRNEDADDEVIYYLMD
ncbi:MAG: hypothetical protein J7L45_02395 [Candidatus Aenigmarchaeota archaeon]|nr:hypothetical protein [Candidatus Aenigmarchaeota archaeon]